jgi:hypothetical protein
MASTYLSKTITPSNYNRRKFTLSAWVKKAEGSAGASPILGFHGSTDYTMIRVDASSGVEFICYQSSSVVARKQANMKLRDSFGWYHVVVAVDTDNGTASNRNRIYVNGEEQTSWSIDTNASSGLDLINNNQTNFDIGSGVDQGGTRGYFSGILSHVHYCEGYQYSASDFGETDATTGEWKIKTSPSVTYGTNGFFILKDGNSVTDQSGNGNNFTVAGGTLTKTEDSPSNVFATLNPLARNATSANNNTLSYGNNRQTTLSVSGAYTPSPSTLGMTSGKYYAEMKVTTLASNCFVGIDGDASNTVRQGINMGYSPYGYCYAQWGGKYNNGTSVASAGATFTAGDIVGIAVDMDNLKVYFSKNGVWQNSGDPTSGSTGTGAFYTIASVDSTPDGAYFFEATNNDADGNSVWDWNFGNGYFGTTAVSSAGTNASGKEYLNMMFQQAILLYQQKD